MEYSTNLDKKAQEQNAPYFDTSKKTSLEGKSLSFNSIIQRRNILCEVIPRRSILTTYAIKTIGKHLQKIQMDPLSRKEQSF